MEPITGIGKRLSVAPNRTLRNAPKTSITPRPDSAFPAIPELRPDVSRGISWNANPQAKVPDPRANRRGLQRRRRPRASAGLRVSHARWAGRELEPLSRARGGPSRAKSASVLGSWGKAMRDAVRNTERWKRRRTPTQDPSTNNWRLKIRVPLFAARTLNATGQSRVTLSLRQERLRAACGPCQEERSLTSA